MKLFLLSEMERFSKTSVNFTLILYNKHVLTLFLSSPLQKHDHHQKWNAVKKKIIIIVIIIIIYCYFIVHPSHKELCGHLVLLQNTTVAVVVVVFLVKCFGQ